MTTLPYVDTFDRKKMVDFSAAWTTAVASCTLPTCELKKAGGCTTAYPADGRLALVGKEVHGRQGEPTGYTEKACVVCTDSKGAKVSEDNLPFSQSADPSLFTKFDNTNIVGNSNK